MAEGLETVVVVLGFEMVVEERLEVEVVELGLPRQLFVGLLWQCPLPLCCPAFR